MSLRWLYWSKCHSQTGGTDVATPFQEWTSPHAPPPFSYPPFQLAASTPTKGCPQAVVSILALALGLDPQTLEVLWPIINFTSMLFSTGRTRQSTNYLPTYGPFLRGHLQALSSCNCLKCQKFYSKPYYAWLQYFSKCYLTGQRKDIYSKNYHFTLSTFIGIHFTFFSVSIHCRKSGCHLLLPVQWGSKGMMGSHHL